MKTLHIDAYTYQGEDKLKVQNEYGDVLRLVPGTVFYYFTVDKPGNYVAASPNSPLIKLTDKAFKTLSDRSVEYLLDAHTGLTPAQAESGRTYKSSIEYQVRLLKYKESVFKQLESFLKKSVPRARLKRIDEINRSSALGKLGVSATVDGIVYEYAFYAYANPFFSFSVWIPKASKASTSITKACVAAIPTIQQNLFPHLRFNVNAVKQSKAVIHLPVKNFYGTVHKWAAVI